VLVAGQDSAKPIMNNIYTAGQVSAKLFELQGSILPAAIIMNNINS